jgi:hypothetical protein
MLKKIAQWLTSPTYSLTPYSPITLLIILVGSYYMAGQGRKDLEGIPKTKFKYRQNPSFPEKILEYTNTPEVGGYKFRPDTFAPNHK